MPDVALPALQVSRLTLGTVQFGMDYGIANRAGQPAYETARDIIRCAFEGGVTCLDTAAAYGDSEDVIGRALAELGIADRVTVVTKLRCPPDDGCAVEVRQMIDASIDTSLRRLRCASLPLCLFHREADFRWIDLLEERMRRGDVLRAGCSVMTPAATTAILQSGRASAVQLPSSVLDHRYLRGGQCALAADRGAALFVRSIYLQGLVHMDPADAPTELAAVRPALGALRSIAAEAGITLAELATRFALGLPGLTSVVVGVDSVDQMRANLAVCGRGPLDAGTREEVLRRVPPLPDVVLMPNRWPPRPA